MSKQPNNPTDIDGFSGDLMRELQKELETIGADLLDMGIGMFDDSKIIGIEKPCVLIFGNVKCDRLKIDKQEFQDAHVIADIKGGKLSVVEVAKEITRALREAWEEE